MPVMDKALSWLLQGDPSVVYQTKRDLLCAPQAQLDTLRSRIERKGWGRALLQARGPDGHWGSGFYRPKWTSTHYTLLDLMGLGIPPSNRQCRQSTAMIFENTATGADGGVNYAVTVRHSDVCINGMVLSLACYFGLDYQLFEPALEFLLRTHMPDGGWNCEFRCGSTHSSVHTTLSVLEGLAGYLAGGYAARLPEVRAAQAAGEQFLLEHRLYQSHRTGRVMDSKMTRLSYPSRWRYDILRALDYFRLAGRPRDPRMDDALALLLRKRRKDGTWPLQAKHPGQVHLEMEEVGKPSRWNTLRALRVLKHFHL